MHAQLYTFTGAAGEKGNDSSDTEGPIGGASAAPRGGDVAALSASAAEQIASSAYSSGHTAKSTLAHVETAEDTVSSLIAKEMSSLRRFAWKLVRDNDHADDLVQDTVVRVLTYAHQWQSGTNFSAWVRTIMRNHFYTDCRRRAHEARTARKDDPRDDRVEPSQIDHRACNELDAAIERLPRTQRAALRLAAYEELGSEEIAVRMNISANAARCHLMRARKNLRELLPSVSTQLMMERVRSRALAGPAEPPPGGGNPWKITL